VIELEHVSKRYGDGWAVRDVSAKIPRGELIAIVGESGSGKTTLLRMINRLIDRDDGTVRVDGTDVRERDPVELRRTIGYVIQHVGLLPHLSIGDNVALVPRLLRWPVGTIAARVDELLALVGLPAERYRDRFPDQLSGGQRQRVGLARALAARPKLLLLDEPFCALDPITRTQLQRELTRIHRELALTSIIVTHDLLEAIVLGDRVAVMRQGTLCQLAAPAELIEHPADAYVAELIATVRAQSDQLWALCGSVSDEQRL
jgi:osmoprotectant transport system ATP-binding protein